MTELASLRPPDSTAETVERLLRRIGELPPMPAVAQKALGLIRNPNPAWLTWPMCSQLDQAVAGLVLRWANSAYFGLKSPVTTLRQAVVYLGQNAIQSRIMAASLAALMDRPAPGYGLERGELWKHAVGVASGARLVAAKFGKVLAEEAYRAGLLADIGKLAFEAVLRGVDTSTPKWQEQSFADLEMARFGVDHATLGAELARRWNLPTALIEAIAFHLMSITWLRPGNAATGHPMSTAAGEWAHTKDKVATLIRLKQYE